MSIAPLRRLQVSSRLCERSGSAPGSPTTSRRIPSTTPGSSRSPALLGRLLDRPPKLFLGHRPDQRLPLLERGGEARSTGAVPVEVGAEHDHHASVPSAARSRSASTNAVRSLLVAAEREHLLELVDDEETGVARRGELGERARPGERITVRSSRPGTLLQRRHDAGAHERRLPASGRADDGQERLGLEARDEVVDELLAPEEELASSGSKAARPLYGHGTSAGGSE